MNVRLQLLLAFIFYFLVSPLFLLAQSQNSGRIVDSISNLPIAGASVKILPNNVVAISDAAGIFTFNKSKKLITGFEISSVGYASKKISIKSLVDAKNVIKLIPSTINLSDIVISGHAGEQYNTISKTDIAMRGVNNSQEILRIIPGIVIGQHQGGGKAEQIFLRGFDCDHGTDFREDVDGMPINMVSHAHGQGFADAHFIIPETIETVDYKKGTYEAQKGNFSTTGFVDFNTKNFLANNEVKLEGGMFNTYRIAGLFNLLSNKTRLEQQGWYFATEYRYSDAYFDHPQHFNRLNFFTKYHGKISSSSYLTVSLSSFWSKWDASGQIPDRAVEDQQIGFYGAIDPYEGGITYRSNFNAQVSTSLHNGDLIKNQLYYSNNHFDLHTNFTFFLVDSINGDEIRQFEDRHLFGYNGSYRHTGFSGNVKFTTEAGLNLRADITNNSGLSHTKDRYITLNQIKLGDIHEWNIAPYLSETVSFNSRFSINGGVRFEQFYHKYFNKLAEDSTFPGIGNYHANANKICPKLSFFYHYNDQTQLYLTSGIGFHSNDTRDVVAAGGERILPSAYSADLGFVHKPLKNLIVNAALWYIGLDEEFVYGGDGGDISFNGKTRRFGFDLSTRYEPFKKIFLDIDLNFAHGRSVNEIKGQDYIPLAPVWTSAGGISYINKKGIKGSVRYRYISNRPANQDYSLTAIGYFITDAVINYAGPKYEIGMTISNIFDRQWRETQFDTVTRLKGESKPVDGICFTPGTPFGLKFSVSYFF